MWNKLPKDIVESNSLETFKTKIFKYFTEWFMFLSYFYNYLSSYSLFHTWVDEIFIVIILTSCYILNVGVMSNWLYQLN